MMEMQAWIDNCRELCLSGISLTKEQIVKLLEIPIGSEEDRYLRKTAKEAAMEKTGGKGYIWCAVGMDYAPCSMNCKFCSFGEAWHAIEESRHVTKEEIMQSVRRYTKGGAAYIILRTTEFYNIDMLLAYVPEIRKAVPGDYQIVLNTGEMTPEIAEKVKEAGVYGVYHACRLREGSDTPFDPKLRLETMNHVTGSGLKLISLTEPVGPEHTPEEIAECFLRTVECGAAIGGAMARFPVPGTPFEDTERLTDEEMAHLIAVLRLSGGDVIRDICVHPASEPAMNSGANVLVVESGAIPRDNHYMEEDFADTDMERGRSLLEQAGFHISFVEQERNKVCILN